MGKQGAEEIAAEKQFIAENQVKDFYYQNQPPFSWKYPETVGEDSNITVNYNSHDSSEYAKARMLDTNPNEGVGIDENAYEPFILFDFLHVMDDKKKEMWGHIQGQKAMARHGKKNPNLSFSKGMGEEDKKIMYDVYDEDELNAPSQELQESFVAVIEAVQEDESMFDRARRVFNGSIALYMPTDIAINDVITYNEDTRKTTGIIAGLLGAETADKINATIMSSTSVAAGAGGVLGWLTKLSSNAPKFVENFPKLAENLGKLGTAGGAILGASAATILGSEAQRHTGKLMNPHEYLAYQSTAMRSFTFTWTFLPDNSDESIAAKEIIKEFRKAAHATRDDYITMTVPDHVVVSYHGAKDMIQMPPTVIESVNVTYNPNIASFFRHNNSPVEIKLGITLKEIVPLYRDDVEGGW